MRINTNISAMNAHRQLGVNQGNSAKSLGKLSSGLRINSAADDAAGLSISEKMRSQVRGLNQAARNAQDGISMIQTAEGALNESHSILQRMRELAVQSATDTNTSEDRVELQREVDELAKELTRISNTTEFNTKNLLAGGLSDTTFHVGANAGQKVSLSISAMDAQTLGVAGSQIAAGTFTAGSTTITGTSAHGPALTAQTYNIVTTVDTAADNGTLTASGGLQGGVGTFAGTYTGDTTQVLQIRIGTHSGGSATHIDYKLGDADWVLNHAVGDAITGTGLTWTGSGTYTDDDVTNKATRYVSTTLTAAVYGAQLQDSSATAIGAKATFAQSATSAVIGNASTGETMTISFANGVAADTATQVITTVGSQAATIGNDGSVTVAATVASGINISSQGAANTAINTINTAVATVSSERSKLGAMQNRLEHTISNLGTSAENLSAAESRIRDVDMAAEMMEFTKTNILNQAATAMLAQANMAPQSVLQLLG